MWLVDKQPAGYIHSHKNLQFLLVLDCGHMVPMDQPKIALDMITRFVEKQSFSAGESKIEVAAADRAVDCSSLRQLDYTASGGFGNSNRLLQGDAATDTMLMATMSLHQLRIIVCILALLMVALGVSWYRPKQRGLRLV